MDRMIATVWHRGYSVTSVELIEQVLLSAYLYLSMAYFRTCFVDVWPPSVSLVSKMLAA
jgi:hypothetical protein